QQVVERPARLERARVLKELELQDEGELEPERPRRERQHRRLAHVLADPPVRGFDVGAGDEHGRDRTRSNRSLLGPVTIRNEATRGDVAITTGRGRACSPATPPSPAASSRTSP